VKIQEFKRHTKNIQGSKMGLHKMTFGAVASVATDLKSDCASYFLEPTGGEMMNAAKRSRSLKRKIHPSLVP
jgi:hypothetical protein